MVELLIYFEIRVYRTCLYIQDMEYETERTVRYESQLFGLGEWKDGRMDLHLLRWGSLQEGGVWETRPGAQFWTC